MPASSFFLQIFLRDGQIEGDAVEHGFKGAIEVSSWDWSASDKSAASSSTTTTGTGTSGTAGTGSSSHGTTAQTRGTGNAGRDDSVEPTPIRFSKQTDRSSTRLMIALGKGEIFPSAKFSLRQELRIGTAAQEFLLELVLEDARLTSYTFGATASEHDVELSEQWAFAYKKMYLDFKNAPGRKAPGIGAEFEMTPGSNTPAPRQPQPSAAQQQGQLDQQQKGMDQQQKVIDRLQQQIDELRRRIERDAGRH